MNTASAILMCVAYGVKCQVELLPTPSGWVGWRVTLGDMGRVCMLSHGGPIAYTPGFERMQRSKALQVALEAVGLARRKASPAAVEA